MEIYNLGHIYLPNGDKIPVIGEHNFLTSQDVTGLYEVKCQWWGNGYWIDDEFYDGNREGERISRIIAVALQPLTAINKM